MNCQDFREQLTDVLDRTLPDDAQAAAVEHARACAACSSLRARVERIVSELAELADAPAPAGLAERVLGNVPRPSLRIVARRLPGELRRVAGWGLVLAGLAWQLGGGSMVARAMDQAAPVVAEARERVARTRKGGGLLRELEPVGNGVASLAGGVRSARRILSPPPDAADAAGARPTTHHEP